MVECVGALWCLWKVEVCGDGVCERVTEWLIVVASVG